MIWGVIVYVRTCFLYSQHCLPDCEETHFKASASAAPFRGCDFKNFGISPLCNISTEEGAETLNPPIWGASVIEQYRLNF